MFLFLMFMLQDTVMKLEKVINSLESELRETLREYSFVFVNISEHM